MPEQIRLPDVVKAKLTNSLSTTPAIPMHDYAGLHLAVPTGYSSTQITVYVSDENDGTFQVLVDADGSDVVRTIAATKTYDFPIAIFAAHWMKFVTNADDSTKTVTLMRKS